MNIEAKSMLKLFENESIFPHKYSQILRRVNSFNPLKYATSRNFINGSVSYLSPYISRGVISTKFILNRLLDQNYNLEKLKNLFKNLLGGIIGSRFGFQKEI